MTESEAGKTAYCAVRENADGNDTVPSGDAECCCSTCSSLVPLVGYARVHIRKLIHSIDVKAFLRFFILVSFFTFFNVFIFRTVLK